MIDPCIKGSIVAPMVEEIRDLRDAGRVGEGELEARLASDSLALLDTKVNPSEWVPLRIYEQFAQLLESVEGAGDPHYMRGRGERAGERLADTGIYQQLRFVEKIRDDIRCMEVYLSDMRLILSIQAALVNVGRWAAEIDPDHPNRVMIVARESESVPGCLMDAMEGFFIGVSRRAHKSGIPWRAERPTRGEIRFRMDRDISNLD
jgi:hypothetical protein